MADAPFFTYQTRLEEGREAPLAAYAALYGRVERTLFAAMQKGRIAMPSKETLPAASA